jgi:hypothetical protein
MDRQARRSLMNNTAIGFHINNQAVVLGISFWRAMLRVMRKIKSGEHRVIQ